MKANRITLSLLLVLVSLNLVVGIMAYRYLGRVDASYTRLLEEGIPFLNAMQTATSQTSRGYAVLVDITQAQSAEEVRALEAELASLRSVSEGIFSSPQFERAVPPELRAAYDELRASRAAVRERAAEFLRLAGDGQFSAAAAYLRTEIYPFHRSYISRLDEFCNRYQAAFAALNRELSAENGRSRTVLFGLSAAPAAVAVALLVTVLSIVLIPLFLVSKQTTAGDLDGR